VDSTIASARITIVNTKWEGDEIGIELEEHD